MILFIVITVSYEICAGIVKKIFMISKNINSWTCVYVIKNNLHNGQITIQCIKCKYEI